LNIYFYNIQILKNVLIFTFLIFSTQNLEKREKQALEQAEARLASINLNVDQTDQEIFDKINFM
jgi:hypothetical protein